MQDTGEGAPKPETAKPRHAGDEWPPAREFFEPAKPLPRRPRRQGA